MSATLPQDRSEPVSETAPIHSDIVVDAGALRAADLNARYGGLDGLELLRVLLTGELKGQIALVSSFGAESAVLLAMAAEIDPAVPVVFLDTGKLFGETITYRDKLVRTLGLTNVQTYRPDPIMESFQDKPGTLWRDNPDACCALRKVEPLERGLSPYTAWVNGMRRVDAPTRKDIRTVDFDAKRGMVKISPIAGWTDQDVREYVEKHGVLVNPLFEDGYTSIGCAPCTRRTAPGEDPRSGRWAGFSKTECGLHT